jgi:hypothetical protein
MRMNDMELVKVPFEILEMLSHYLLHPFDRNSRRTLIKRMRMMSKGRSTMYDYWEKGYEPQHSDINKWMDMYWFRDN